MTGLSIGIADEQRLHKNSTKNRADFQKERHSILLLLLNPNVSLRHGLMENIKSITLHFASFFSGKDTPVILKGSVHSLTAYVNLHTIQMKSTVSEKQISINPFCFKSSS